MPALPPEKIALARRMNDDGELAAAIHAALGQPCSSAKGTKEMLRRHYGIRISGRRLAHNGDATTYDGHKHDQPDLATRLPGRLR